jgi:VIT1/CCC1 family predicted Fe2+/Mn2+ transporter
MKTAVEFYREELNALISLRETKFKTEQEIFEQAKAMEKEQMHAEYMRGWKDGLTKQQEQ